MSETLNKINKYKYKLLKELLSQCTEEQQKFFKRMYPEGIKKMKEMTFKRAIQQVERTIENNKKNEEKINIKYNKFEIMDI